MLNYIATNKLAQKNIYKQILPFLCATNYQSFHTALIVTAATSHIKMQPSPISQGFGPTSPPYAIGFGKAGRASQNSFGSFKNETWYNLT
jgi:hypothetical protein